MTFGVDVTLNTRGDNPLIYRVTLNLNDAVSDAGRKGERERVREEMKRFEKASD